MKYKLAQRILFKILSTKINAVGLISPAKAAQIAYKIFSTPARTSNKKQVPPVFKKAIRVSLKLNGTIIRGFQWKHPDSQSKKILIVHGFSSNIFKFEPYVLTLKQAGFEVLAFDAPAHGISDGKEINALIYRDMILAIENEFGNLFGMIAHSLGGLAASMALEQLNMPENRRLVLIAPATETTTTIDGFYQMLSFSDTVKTAFQEFIQQLANEPPSFYSVARIARKSLAPTLWIHDEEDFICPISDVNPVIAENIPTLEFFITKGLGHNYIYKNPKTIQRVIHFLTGRKEGDFL